MGTSFRTTTGQLSMPIYSRPPTRRVLPIIRSQNFLTPIMTGNR
jgi:hypothetical protein